jgi:hypothetical protein
MRKYSLAIVLAVSLLALPLVAGAATFTFTHSQLLNDTRLFQSVDTINGVTLDLLVSDKVSIYYPATLRMGGEVGFKTKESIGYGENLIVGVGSLTLDSSYDSFSLKFFNDNDDLWGVRLFAEYTDDSGTHLLLSPNDPFSLNGYNGDPKNESVVLSLGLNGIHSFTNMGFIITMLDKGAGEDIPHMSVSPVPEPGTLLLLGSGLVCLAAVGNRRLRRKS